jgi:hypothetical protein
MPSAKNEQTRLIATTSAAPIARMPEDVTNALPVAPATGRTRVISLRLSEREFESLKHRSQAEGARSVSDYVRELISTSPRGITEATRNEIGKLWDEIRALRSEMRRGSDLTCDTRTVAPTQADSVGNQRLRRG